jgi:PIN domain nuclease of toxin-antitoxin system
LTVLIDTHALLWWLALDRSSLPSGVRALLEHADTRVVVSAAVVWEIAIKCSLGKLEAPGSLAHVLDHAGIPTLPITTHHAEIAGGLPPIHRDPFDRMLIAQASAEDLPIITADAKFAEYGIDTVWT